MSKTVKVIIGVVIALVLGSLLLIIGIVGCGIVSAIAIPQFAKTKQKAVQLKMMQEAVDKAEPYKETALQKAKEQVKTHRAKILQKTLDAAMFEYEAIEGKMPQRFDDFVLLYGELDQSHTYSFGDLETKITEPNTPGDLHMKRLKVIFKNGVEAMYYLKNTGVEMEITEQ